MTAGVYADALLVYSCPVQHPIKRLVGIQKRLSLLSSWKQIGVSGANGQVVEQVHRHMVQVQYPAVTVLGVWNV